MKKYIIFAISFTLLFSLFQILSGALLTFMYIPDIANVWNLSTTLPQETTIKGSHSPFLITLFIALLSATIAYFIPQKIFNKGAN